MVHWLRYPLRQLFCGFLRTSWEVVFWSNGSVPRPILFISKFNVVLMLHFCMSCLNFLNISTTFDRFWVLVMGFWMVYSSKCSFSNSPFFRRSRRCSKSNWCSCDLEVSGVFWSNKFDIILMALNGISFKSESLTYSIKSPIIFSIHLLARSLWKKEQNFTPGNDLIESIVLELILIYYYIIIITLLLIIMLLLLLLYYYYYYYYYLF